MRSKFLTGLICPVLLLVASASAVTLDLSSTQEGAIVGPGDSLQVIISITNDTAQNDVVVVKLTKKVVVNGQTFVLGASRGMRLRLEPGQTVTRTFDVTLPIDIPSQIPQGSLDLTIRGTATGLKTRTTATDSLSLTFRN